MKKVFPFIFSVLLLGVSCSNQSTDLTDEQKATIISEVGEQVDGLQSVISKLDFEAWSEYWSEDEYISVISDLNFFDTRSAWVDFVANAWSGIENRSYESSEKRITPLTLNLALVTRMTSGSNILKSGDKNNFKVQLTMIWKKEAVGWKIIHVNESVQRTPIEE